MQFPTCHSKKAIPLNLFSYNYIRVVLIGVAALFCVWQSHATAQVLTPPRQSNGHSAYPPMTYDGLVVAFYSLASNLVSGDTNNTGDIFVHDRRTGITTRVSISSTGEEGNGDSIWPSISNGGRFVAFTSQASNLASDDTNNFPDIFVHDRQTKTTMRVNISSAGEQSNNDSYTYFPSISIGGHFVTFASMASNLVPDDINNTWDVFVHELATGITTRVSVDSQGQEGNGPSLHPVISGDGSAVAFHSSANNLVPDDRNNVDDVFVHELATGITTRVSVDSQGQESNNGADRASISSDGRVVAFSSMGSNLSLNDTNEAEDVFVHDLEALTTTIVSVSSTGELMARPILAPSVCCIVSLACCILDRKSVISPDGVNVVFRSDANNLVADDRNSYQDLFVHNRLTKTTTRVSINSQGGEANGISMHHGVSFDGRYIAFSSEASNLVEGDTNGFSDIFVHDRETGMTTRVSIGSDPE